MNENNPLDAYVDELLGEESSDQAKRKELMSKVNEAIDQALIESLPMPQLDKLEQAVKERRINDQVLTDLLEEAHVNTAVVVHVVLNDFRTNYLKGEKR